jgi:xanthine/uracil permease
VFFFIIPLEKKKLAYWVQEFLSSCLVVATVSLVFLDLLLFLIKKKVNLYLQFFFILHI